MDSGFNVSVPERLIPDSSARLATNLHLVAGRTDKSHLMGVQLWESYELVASLGDGDRCTFYGG